MKAHSVIFNIKLLFLVLFFLAVFFNFCAMAQNHPAKTAVQIKVVEVGEKDSVVVDTTVMLEKSKKKRKIFVGGLNDIVIYGNDSILKNVSIYDTHNILGTRQNHTPNLLNNTDSVSYEFKDEKFDIALYENDSIIIHKFNKDNGIETPPPKTRYFPLLPGTFYSNTEPIDIDEIMTELQTQMLHVDSLIRQNIDWKKIDSLYFRGIDTLPRVIMRKLQNIEDINPPQDNFENKSEHLEDIIDELEPGDGTEESYPRGENDYPNKAPIYKAPATGNKNKDTE